MPKQKTSENDLHELLGNDCLYNEGTICVVNRCISVKRIVFRAWAHERAPLNSQWLVQLIARASEHCVIRSSPCNASKQCILAILLDCMVLFTPDYLVNLVKRLRVHVKVIMKQATQSRMFKHTCNQLYSGLVAPISSIVGLLILYG